MKLNKFNLGENAPRKRIYSPTLFDTSDDDNLITDNGLEISHHYEEEMSPVKKLREKKKSYLVMLTQLNH